MLGVWNLFEGASINGNTRCQSHFGNPAYLSINRKERTVIRSKPIESQLNLVKNSRRAKSKLDKARLSQSKQIQKVKLQQSDLTRLYHIYEAKLLPSIPSKYQFSAIKVGNNLKLTLVMSNDFLEQQGQKLAGHVFKSSFSKMTLGARIVNSSFY